MGWPQWIVVCMAGMRLGLMLALNGRPRTGKHSFWGELPFTALLAALLYAGGFFTPAHAQTPPPQAARYRLMLVREAQSQWGLGAPVAALAAQVHAESGWNADAVSRAGARGMAQFMPDSATWWCTHAGIAPADCLPHNPAWALRALAGYDLFLFNRAPAYMGHYDRLWLALRGYNGGEAHVRAEALATGQDAPTRAQIDAACGKARRAAVHCAENLSYPQIILVQLQPLYASWGAVWAPPVEPPQ